MKKVFKQHILSASILLTIFLIPLTFSMFHISQDNNLDENEETLITEEHQYSDFLSDNYIPNTSDTYYTGNEYGLIQWWETQFRYRVAIELEELEGVDRYEPVETYLTFDDNEHYDGSARLVSFNATGADEWSSELPVQVWNITYYASMFIHSCTITFLADVSANSNQTYFLYYNEDLTDIGLPSYDTNFNCVLAGGKLTVTVGASGDLYEAVLEEGKGVFELNKDAINFHTDDSLSPEKQLAHPNLKFLAHVDEGIGNYVNDSTENVNAGQLVNSPTWTNGIVKYGLDFEQSASQFVNFGAALEGPGDPFNGASTEFTITAWIKPESITSTQASNHGTYNCFMAKAGEAPSNDIFEIGVNNDGTIHVYLDTEKKDTSADFGDGGNVVPGEWNFIAVKYDSGSMQVRINDDWYSRNAWVSAKDLDEADGSNFTIGSTDHINTYFDGVIDEVAIYNIALSDNEVENNKYGSEISVIQTITEIENGDVFSRYELTWTESFDMHVSDMVTFYYDYNLWSIDRTIYFDSDFNGVFTTSQMAALNTHFDLSGLTQNDQFYYLYDGILVEGLTNDGFIVENYTVIHDAIHTTTKTTLGVFVADFYASGDAFSEINYFKGYVTYDTFTDTVSYNPGAINDFTNNADPNNQLHIEFWEYIDHINHTAYSPKLTGEQMIELFENQYMALKNPLNLYIFEREGGFYNIEVNVTDIDDNPVSGATVQLWNETDHSMTWTEYTDDNGIATFTRVRNGTYIANASYVKYGQPPLTITTPKILEINENTVDSSGLNKTSFTDVQLTSLNLTINRVNSTGDFQEYLEGAEVSFYRNSGLGDEFIGSEYVDDVGNVIFRWQNFTNPEDGNITFSIKWFDFDPTSVTALGDLDGVAAYPFSNVTFFFYIANFSVVNCSFTNTFDSNLEFTVEPNPIFNQMLGATLYFQVNFTYIQDGLYVFPVEGATVTYNIKWASMIINTQTLYFTEIGGGLYNLTIDTSNPVESGGSNWLSENDYSIEVEAFMPGFISGDTSTSFILDPRTSTLIAN
ncbi:MAG: LamG-like jellyroll fold domain-containing protein, partial [Candidatus Hermodarchaeota archaeon]